MNDTNYREILIGALQDPRCRLNGGQVAAIVAKFDDMAKRCGPEKSYAYLCDHFGNVGEPKTYAKQFMEAKASAERAGTIQYLPMSQTARDIESELAAINANHRINIKPSKQKIAELKIRFNRNIQGLQAELCSSFTRGARIPIISDEDRAKLAYDLPRKEHALNNQMESWAKYKKGKAAFD